MTDRPLVSIIVVTMNTPRLTRSCLKSVIQNTLVPYEIIVVNNSRAKKIRQCLKKFQSIHIIQNSRNVGYARAANQGALKSRGEFLCFLNSDTWVPPGWVLILLDAAKKPHVGAVTPTTNNYGYPNSRNFKKMLKQSDYAARITRHLVKRYENQVEPISVFCGFCVLIPRVVIMRVGLFDERYYFGGEDHDYSLRLLLQGYRIVRAKSLFIFHSVGGSSSTQRHRRLEEEAWRKFVDKWARFFKIPGEKYLHYSPRSKRLIIDRPKFRQAIRSKFKKYSGENPHGATRHAHPKKPVHSTGHARTARSYFLRTGFSMALPNVPDAHTLVSLNTLDRFRPDNSSFYLWSLLDGSRSAKEIANRLYHTHRTLNKIGVYEIQRRLNAFLHHSLIKQIKPVKPDSVVVTAMMPAHNAQAWIGETIASVLAQDYNDFELLIVDDASTDQTAHWIRHYASWHPKIRFLKNAYQLGIPKTRNKILKLARGKYIAVCDADDLARPSWLKRFVQILDSRPDVGWVYGDRLDLNKKDQPVTLHPALSINGQREFKNNIMQHGGALIRKQLIMDVGGYDESYYGVEDYDLAFKIAKQSKLLTLPGEIHYLCRRYPQSNSSTNPWAVQETRDLIHRVKKSMKIR